jgi:hypothetical protein
MRVRLKYGNRLFHRGTEGEAVRYKDSPKMQQVFPGMKETPASTFVIVRIKGEDCLFEKRELEFLEE